MDAWNTYELQSVCSRLSSGKGIRAKDISETGKYPVYGGNGIRGYTDTYNFDGECAVIGRQGANCGNVRFFSGKAYMTEHAVVVCANENNHTRFLSYLLSTMQLGRLSGQSAQPGLAVKTLGIQPVCVPKLDAQKRIASVLGALDDKIALNQQINKNLEEQAQAIYKAWFVDFEPWHGDRPNSWEEGVLGDYVEIKRGGSPRPIQDYLVDSGLRWLKISDVTALQSPFIIDIKEHIKEDGLNKTVFLKAGALVLSNSATPGIPKILDVDSCIHDGWLYFPESKLSSAFLYLLFKFIRKDLVQLGNGSVFTNLKTDILKNYPFSMPDNNTLSMFDDIVTPLFQSMNNIARENKRLSNLRDALLPRLMSGEIDVSRVEV